MTAHSIDTASRRRRVRARRRLPLDLIALALILAAFYLAARLLSGPEPATKSAPPVAAPAPIQALPVLPAIEPLTEPAPLRVRRVRTPDAPPPAEPAAHDPFAGIEALSAQELDAVSQAR